MIVANSYIQNLNPYIPGKPIVELQRELGIPNIIKLASNENPQGTNPKVQQALQKQIDKINFYPEGSGYDLVVKLSQKYQIKKKMITLGNGSNDVLDMIARIFLNPDKNSIFSQYAFAVYPIATQSVGATAKIAKANSENHNQPLGHDLDNFLNLIDDKTTVIFIANPNNPTGGYVDKKQLTSFLSCLPSHIIAVLDEAYIEYVDDKNYPDGLDYIKKYPNLIITRTFSKIYGLAGLRVGYAISSEYIADLLNRVRQPFNVNSMAQVAARVAIDDDEFVKKCKINNNLQKSYLEQEYKKLNLKFIPSVANFISVKFGTKSSDIYRKLLEHGIIVRPIDNYKMTDYLRISIGNEPQNKQLIKALQKIL
ncbi:MAG: histidinol-phosphate transaminase [Gammaproteobacteria bacterium]|nr:MAG: histidinol-phosphate transaminase [Gammaproteobacteria bacterium]